MATKCSSSSAMKASLVLMLLFGAVVAAHAAYEVEILNQLCHNIKMNGMTIGAGATVKVTTNTSTIVFTVTDAVGKVVSYSVPADGCKYRVVCRGCMVNVELVTCAGPIHTTLGATVGALDVVHPNCTCCYKN